MLIRSLHFLCCNENFWTPLEPSDFCFKRYNLSILVMSL